jgi:hypothetical protein
MRLRAVVGFVLVIALGAPATAPARDAHISTLRAWDLPSYTLIAAAGENPAPFVQRMANVEGVLSKMLATPVRRHGVPTSIWLAPPTIWARYLAPSRNIDGEFVPRRFANYLLLEAGPTRAAQRGGVQHEYTHFFLRTQFRGLYPLWFDEGMAELMQSTRFGPHFATIGLPDFGSEQSWVPMAKLFTIDKSSPEYLSLQTNAVHRESWALVHRGFIAETAFGGQMFAYLSALNRLMPVEDAAAGSFGMTFPELDEVMHQYLKNNRFAIAQLPYEPAARVPLPAGRVLGATEALEGLASVMLDTGFNRAHVGELIEAAERADPGGSAPAVLRLRVAVRTRNDAAMLRIADSMQYEDAATQRGAALALFERIHPENPEDALTAAQRAALARRVFALLDRALTTDPGDAESAWAFGLLAARLHLGLESALDRLDFARTRMIDHPDLAEATARVLEARGADEAAILPHLLVALRYTTSGEQRAWAAQLIRELRDNEKEKAPQ